MLKRCLGCLEEYSEQNGRCPHCGSGSIVDCKEGYHLAPGSWLENRYLLGKALGRGGFGVTYIGWDKVLDKKVAIKEYLPIEYATRVVGEQNVSLYMEECALQFQQGKEKFVSEAKRLAKCRDINGIVQIYDAFEANMTAYIVMEYLEGETLEEYLSREGRIDVNRALQIVFSVGEALCKVHAQGIIHRNIAPDNIFITIQNDIKLMNFGAARTATIGTTKSLSVIVKPGYAPEEQYRSGGNQGTWTDVYALAATLYRMITGELPDESIDRIGADTLKRPSLYGIHVSPSVDAAIIHALQCDASERTMTMEQFLAELREHRGEKNPVSKYSLFSKASSCLKLILICSVISIICVLYLLFAEIGQNKQRVFGTDVSQYRQVPDMVGLTVQEASNIAKSLGVTLQKVKVITADELDEGTILSQNIPCGTVISEGMSISVVVVEKSITTTGTEREINDVTTEDITEQDTTEERKKKKKKSTEKEKTTEEKKTTEEEKTTEEKKTTEEEKTTEEKKTTEEEKTSEESTELIIIED